MSQPSVAEFFTTRKRKASNDLRNKAKVIVLDQDRVETISDPEESCQSSKSTESSQPLSPSFEKSNIETDSNDISINNVVKVNHLETAVKSADKCVDSDKSSNQKVIKMNTRLRTVRTRKLSSQEGQTDIRETFLKMKEELSSVDSKNVLFEKKGALSPTKKRPLTPKKTKRNVVGVPTVSGNTSVENERSATGSVTPKKVSTMGKLNTTEMSLDEIKSRINNSPRLAKLKALMARQKGNETKLKELQSKREAMKPQIQKFERIQLEVPISPQKGNQSPSKMFLSPTKNVSLSKMASPQRRLLFSLKGAPASPVKSSPTKVPAYQRYQSLVESDHVALPLPFNYRFLAEAFRCVDTIVAMLFNRKETITFKKLKPAVQELLRRNFNLEHLAQIKTIYSDAFEFHQEKHRTFGSTSKQDKYELIITPIIESKNGRNTPDADDVQKSASEKSMNPSILLQRRRHFFNILLGRVKDQHEEFLLNLETPIVVPKEKITRWHPEFDVESCKPIERSDLPQPPNVEQTSAKDVLEKAKSLFHCNTRMEKALQLLVKANMTSKSPEALPQNSNSTSDATTQVAGGDIKKVEISIVDTPPSTPTIHSSYPSMAFKGIPKALLEKVRAKQAAKALEAMTRTPDADKEAAVYARLPELAKILRNIFVVEKKGVLTVEFVIDKLDNSLRTKLTPNEIEEHIKLLCKLLPTWTSIRNVRKIDYLKLARDMDLNKIVKRLEIMAKDKLKI